MSPDRNDRLEREISRRVVDGNDDPGQIAKDLGCSSALTNAVRDAPELVED